MGIGGGTAPRPGPDAGPSSRRMREGVPGWAEARGGSHLRGSAPRPKSGEIGAKSAPREPRATSPAAAPGPGLARRRPVHPPGPRPRLIFKSTLVISRSAARRDGAPRRDSARHTAIRRVPWTQLAAVRCCDSDFDSDFGSDFGLEPAPLKGGPRPRCVGPLFNHDGSVIKPRRLRERDPGPHHRLTR